MAAAGTITPGPIAEDKVPLMEDEDPSESELEDAEEAFYAAGGRPDLENSLKSDFAYRNNVAGAAKHVRMGFIRKVYALLGVQLTVTTIIAGICLFTPPIKTFVHDNPWMLMIAFVLSFVLLIALHIKRRETPINLVLLAAFTIVEAYTIGVLVTFYDVSVVIQAFFMTTAVVVGLTAYTFQTKRDFSSWGAALFAGLWILILGGFMRVFVGGEIADTGMAVMGAFLFSGFIIFDTQMIMTRVNPEEYILATIELYLDIINLFIEILKILDKLNRN